MIQRRFNVDEILASTSTSKAGVKPRLRFLSNNDCEEVGDLGTNTAPERSKSDSSAKSLKMLAESKAPSLSHDRILAAKISRTIGRRIMVMLIR